MFRSQPTTGCMGAAAARAKWRSRTARSLLRARPRARSLSARDDKQERARLLASAGIDRRAQLGCDDRLLPGAVSSTVARHNRCGIPNSFGAFSPINWSRT